MYVCVYMLHLSLADEFHFEYRKKQGTGPYPTVEECVASGVKFYPVGQNKGCTIDYGSLRLY